MKNILVLILFIVFFQQAFAEQIIFDPPTLHCPKDYAPVCWYDSKTYRNSCYAENLISNNMFKVRYEWECLQWKIWEKVDTTIKDYEKNELKEFKDYQLALFYEWLIEKIDKQNIYTYWDLKFSIYNYIKSFAMSRVRDIYIVYIDSNTDNIIKTKRTWDKWYNIKLEYDWLNNYSFLYTSRGNKINLDIIIKADNFWFNVDSVEEEIE